MADIATTGALTAIGYPLVQKVLGPSAEYLGDQLKLFTEKRVANIRSIFEKSESKLSEEYSDKGCVSPQILKDILFDGSFCEDTISQEYYAGVLASSKTENSLDNRGKAISSIISKLSSYQLTTHYILYYLAYCLHTEKSFDHKEWFFINNDLLLENLNLNLSSDAEKQAVIEHVFLGLETNNLIKSIESLNYKLTFDGQYHYLLNSLGIELFLWANGSGQKPLNYFYSEECLIHEIEEINIDRHF